MAQAASKFGSKDRSFPTTLGFGRILKREWVGVPTSVPNTSHVSPQSDMMIDSQLVLAACKDS